MSRVFTFGCSFTGYWYPTWADILINEAEVRGSTGYNFGRSGAGNLFINLRVWEAHAKYKFTPDDYVLICWTGYNREDKWVKGRSWITPGNLATQNVYDSWFVENYHDVRFCAMRDCALISSTQLALKQLGVNAIHFSIAPLLQNNEWHVFQTFEEQKDIIETYNIKLDAAPVMEYIGTMDQHPDRAHSRIKIKYTGFDPMPEWHPLPEEHLRYLKDNLQDKVQWLDNISESSLKLVNDWTTLLHSYDAAPIDKLGWKSKTPKDLW
jgi:hypothetical protein